MLDVDPQIYQQPWENLFSGEGMVAVVDEVQLEISDWTVDHHV